MSLIPSLLIYNPLEAAVLFMFCGIFVERSLKLSDIRHCYLLGAINLALQYPTLFISNGFICLIYDLVSVFILAYLLCRYMNTFLDCNVKFTVSLLAYLFLFITIPACIGFVTIFVDYDFIYKNMIEEFLANIFIKAIQFMVLYIIRKVAWKRSGKVKNIT